MKPEASQPPWGPRGNAERHAPADVLERDLAALDAPTRHRGRVVLIVARRDDGERDTPARVFLTEAGGVPGDAWGRTASDRPQIQLAVMSADVARLIANGQDLTLFGDNLFLDLDLSEENLPAGSRLRAGDAILEVTPQPHSGCSKFRQRFGDDALRFTGDQRFRHLRLRGVYMRVIEEGAIAVGDPVEVLSRDAADPETTEADR